MQRANWIQSTNIYEVNLRQYTAEGSFIAFVNELPRLKDMGVETLWLMPIYPIGILKRKGTMGSYYSIMNYTAVSNDYGTKEDFSIFMQQAHALGFKVILDWVANHTSWDNVWTVSHPEFFSRDDAGNFRPPFPDWEDVIHLNYDNRDLWKAMIEAMRYWITEFDIDGFRCDMAHLVPLEFWKAAREELDETKQLFWMAETEEASYLQVFDAILTWEFLHKMEAYWKNEAGINDLFNVLHKYDSAMLSEGIRIYFTSNHDENSHSGSEYERMGDGAKAFAVFCATWNGMPLVYSGQELPNKKRLLFFEKDSIDWNSSYELHDFYKTLLTLKKNNPALRTGDNAVHTYWLTTNNANVIAYLRKNGGDEVLVILNLGREAANFILADKKLEGNFKDVFNETITDFSNQNSFEMLPWEFLVFEKK